MFVSAGRTVRFFFFQAEDGIRDGTVTGVQTCALPISPKNSSRNSAQQSRTRTKKEAGPAGHRTPLRLRRHTLRRLETLDINNRKNTLQLSDQNHTPRRTRNGPKNDRERRKSQHHNKDKQHCSSPGKRSRSRPTGRKS